MKIRWRESMGIFLSRTAYSVGIFDYATLFLIMGIIGLILLAILVFK